MAFDIGEYTPKAHRVHDDDVYYDAFTEWPLSRSALRCLRYMSDVESHTICYRRDLLVTPSHKDPEITAFLTIEHENRRFWAPVGSTIQPTAETAGQVPAPRATVTALLRARRAFALMRTAVG